MNVAFLSSGFVFALAIVGTGAPTFAQERAIPITAPMRHAGIYHLESGTWTRKAGIEGLTGLGADVVYNNTCEPGFYFPLSGDTIIDEGRLPSPSSPTNTASRPGCQVAYTIEGIDFRYCTTEPGSTGFELAFYSSYTGCSSVAGLVPTATLTLDLPGSAGGTSCWTTTIDLGAQSFTLLADGDGAYQGQSATNLFGWSARTTNPLATGTGPYMAGAPGTCKNYDGTRWDNGPTPPFWPNNAGESGTGMGALDQFYVEGGPSGAFCQFGSGNIFRSFYLKLWANACGPTADAPFCFGDGSGAPCPCGNTSAPGSGGGCLNSTGVGAKLVAIGDPSIANDTILFSVSQIPVNSTAVFFQGTAPVNGGAGNVFGDGLRCAGGALSRIGTDTANALGIASYPRAGGASSVSKLGAIGLPGQRAYQVLYRNNANFCTPSTFNTSNGATLTWGA